MLHSTPSTGSRRFGLIVAAGLFFAFCQQSTADAKGEPAASFLKQLRASGYFELAVKYLERIDQYPGVDPEFKSAVELEKAQTFIDAAVNSRSVKDRDQYFVNAEQSLATFLKNGSHRRASEARMQLGKLQMVRATQLMLGEPDDAKRKSARESYLAAGKTFDAIVVDLKEKLTAMRGANVKPEDKPLREQYQADYLQAQLSAGDVRKLAANTYANPGKDGKALLTEAEGHFKNLAAKYSKYVQGAESLLHLGDIYKDLGDQDKALDHYLRMLESPDIDALRPSKYLAAAGLIQVRLAKDPPAYKEAISRTSPLVKTLRLNEKRQPNVQHLRLWLAKAYLAKSKDTENNKPGDVKKAVSEGRQLLVAASKIPGPHLTETKEILSGLGIEQETAELPTAEPPKSLEDALEKAGKLLEVAANLGESLKLLEQQQQTPELKTQQEDIRNQLTETQSIAIQILRGGLGMINSGADNELVNQARQYLAYLVFQRKDFRDSAVVGEFLARNAPGTDMGLNGGVIALNSLQLLLNEVAEADNNGLLKKLDGLSDYMMKTWPNNPKAAMGQTMRIRLLLQKNRYDEARTQINRLANGAEKYSLQRLQGQLLWNDSIEKRRAKDEAGEKKSIEDGIQDLSQGLNGLASGMASKETLQASMILAKMYSWKQQHTKALEALDHPEYGASKNIDRLGAPSARFTGDLYSTELKILVQLMIQSNDPSDLLKRAEKTMEKLRAAYAGQAGQATLTSTYRLLAKDVSAELETAPPAKKTKLVNVFRVLLERISASTKERSTLLWVAQTLVDLGKASMAANQTKATGQALELLKTADQTFTSLNDESAATQFQHAKCKRLMGQYQSALDVLTKILKDKPMMLDAQKEAALSYEAWAAELKPAVAAKAYNAALVGGRPNAKGENIVWGWGKISRLTNGKPKYRDVFFESRYHVALTRYLQGKKANDKRVMEKAVTDITGIEGLFPDMGGAEQRKKFDTLLREIQKAVGQKVTGLKPLPAGK